MSGGALAAWWATFAAANTLLLFGWALQGWALAAACRRVAREIRNRRAEGFPRRLAELALGGFVLVQIGAIAGLILLDMKGL